MRYIDKSEILSTRYKEWLADKKNTKDINNEDYREYYADVVMNLLYCQKGVCAYTEMELCAPQDILKEKWQNGRYIVTKRIEDTHGNISYESAKSQTVETFGTLDHFIAKSKPKTKPYWDWSNLFVIHPKINGAKGAKDVDDILKPDSPDYKPFELLAYNNKTHCFFAHPDRPEDERKRINKMIQTLQLNYEVVHSSRKRFLNCAKEHDFAEEFFPVYCFFTAYEMFKAAYDKERAEVSQE